MSSAYDTGYALLNMRLQVQETNSDNINNTIDKKSTQYVTYDIDDSFDENVPPKKRLKRLYHNEIVHSDNSDNTQNDFQPPFVGHVNTYFGLCRDDLSSKNENRDFREDIALRSGGFKLQQRENKKRFDVLHSAQTFLQLAITFIEKYPELKQFYKRIIYYLNTIQKRSKDKISKLQMLSCESYAFLVIVEYVHSKCIYAYKKIKILTQYEYNLLYSNQKLHTNVYHFLNV